MKDGWLRRCIKKIAAARYLTDLRITRTLKARKDPPRFDLRGACEGCGLCCETPTIRVHQVVMRLRSLRALFLWWHRVINGFHWVSEDRKEGLFVFECSHFDKDTRQCDSYDSRPGMCRDYPRNLLDSVKPELFEQCGFRAVDKNAAKFKQSIEALDLPPEKKAELLKKLYLNDPDSNTEGSNTEDSNTEADGKLDV